MIDSLVACMAYLDKMPVAQSGAGGHKATLLAAMACKRFGLSASEIWEAMAWYNDNRCNPKWTERELRHKIDSVVDMTVTKPLGNGQRQAHHARAFVAPAPVVIQPDPRPVYQQSAQAEELWWARWCANRGTTLEEFDRKVGNL